MKECDIVALAKKYDFGTLSTFGMKESNDNAEVIQLYFGTLSTFGMKEST